MEKYEKIRVIGRGAYGTVYLVRRLADRKLVIIKQIPVEQMTKDERQAALNEVKVLSMLHHPNIIEYYENFLEDKALMIVMEYAPGGTLFEYLQQRNDRLLEEEEVINFFSQMLLSLQHVHSKFILHRDLKTQNILLDKKKQSVKIGDFGISKVLSSKSKAYTVVGTPCYISPELCEGKPYNQKSDIWALGCVLYELASLKRAFEAQNLPALILKIMRGTFAPISEKYSKKLRQLILSMLHLDPNRRPNISQIMATPIILNALLALHTDFGQLPCRRAPRPLSSITGGASRGRNTVGGKGSTNQLVMDSADAADELPSKPHAQSTVFCWGNGTHLPVKLPLPSCDTIVTQVSAGRTQKAAVTKNGRLMVWETQLGGVDTGVSLPGAAVATDGVSYIPRFLEGQAAVTIQHVSCGDLFTACLTDRGILMTFGSGANGCLGHGNYSDVLQAKIVEKLLGFEVVQVSCGASHVLAVTNEHEVFSWGRGDNGRLGLDDTECHCSPQEVVIPDRFKPCSVHCGVDGSMVLTLDCQLLCSGSNRDNKLGLDGESQVEEVHMFTLVQSEPINNLAINRCSLGTSHSAIITETAEMYTLGSNQFGQLGHAETDTDSRRPQQPEGLENVPVATVACGDTYTVIATEDGDLYSWGKSARGRLGRSNKDTDKPRAIEFDIEEPFAVISISSSHGTTIVATKS